MTDPVPATPLAPDDDLDIVRDPEHAADAKRQRERWLNVVEIPILRIGGMALVLMLVVVHQRVESGDWFPRWMSWFAGWLAAYSLIAWALLARFYDAWRGPVHLGHVFLATDLVPWITAVHLTGGPRSWLFALLFVRVADQIGTSFRQTFVFGGLSLIAWSIYLVWRETRGLPVDWMIESVKLLTLAAITCYLSWIASTAASYRDRTRRVVHYARSLIGQLETQSEELRAANMEAEAANRLKSEFLANVSHELRTPMNAVIGMTDLLLGTPLSREQQEYAQTVHTSADHLLSVINDILDMSKMDAGQFGLSPAPFAPRRVIADVEQVVGTQATAKGLALNIEVEPDVPAWCYADAGRLRQVLINLAYNAVKFTERGDVTLRASWIAAESRLRFDVIDTGIGLSEPAMARVFDAFYQADTSASRRFEGTGLGLAIAQRLVTLMRGRIGLQSEEGRGSHFWFTAVAPIAAPGTLSHAERAGTSAAAPPDGGGGADAPRRLGDDEPLVEPLDHGHGPRPVILLAEDNVINQRVASRMVQRLGYAVAVAQTGRDALEALATRSDIALVLMDCQMPLMDGFEATRAIRRLDPARAKVPIVAMTATSMPNVRQECFAAGMNDFLSKPVRLEDLRLTIERWLARGN